MKKRVLKKWVENLLVGVMFGLMITLAFDCNNFLLFITSKIVAVALIVLIVEILTRYTNLLD